MPTKPPPLKDGARCVVIGGTHEGKSGTVRGHQDQQDWSHDHYGGPIGWGTLQDSGNERRGEVATSLTSRQGRYSVATATI